MRAGVHQCLACDENKLNICAHSSPSPIATSYLPLCTCSSLCPNTLFPLLFSGSFPRASVSCHFLSDGISAIIVYSLVSFPVTNGGAGGGGQEEYIYISSRCSRLFYLIFQKTLVTTQELDASPR